MVYCAATSDRLPAPSIQYQEYIIPLLTVISNKAGMHHFDIMRPVLAGMF
jgi:hypothetical protein